MTSFLGLGPLWKNYLHPRPESTIDLGVKQTFLPHPKSISWADGTLSVLVVLGWWGCMCALPCYSPEWVGLWVCSSGTSPWISQDLGHSRVCSVSPRSRPTSPSSNLPKFLLAVFQLLSFCPDRRVSQGSCCEDKSPPTHLTLERDPW